MSQKNWYDDIQGAVDVTPPSGRGKFDFYRDIARAAGQGLSLGFGDEIEAAVTSFFGKRPYSEVVKEIRGDISQFKEQAPVVAYGAEILASMITGGAGTARAVGANVGREAIKRAGLAGGAEAAIYGAGTGETPEQRIMGATIGAPVGAVTAGLGQKYMPALQEGAKSMLKRGYPLTMGQAVGGKVSSIEQKMSLPFLQESIQEARRRPQQMFVRETIDEALKPLGVKVPEGFTGETAVDFAEDAIQEAYAKVVPKAKFSTAAPDTEIESILQQALKDGVFDADDLKKFRKDLAEAYTSKKRNGAMTGELFKEAESDISSAIQSFRMSGNRRQARVMRDIQGVLRDQFAKQNPDLPDLQAANKAYRNMRPIVKLSDRKVATGGEFTPAALVKEETRGRARTSPEVVRAREARDILGQTVPDSGTASRMLLASPFTAYTPKRALGLGSLVAGSALYEFPKLGARLGKGDQLKGAVTAPARFMRALAPAAGEAAPSAMGGLLSPAEAGEMPIEDVVSIGGRNYAITNQGATYTLLGD